MNNNTETIINPLLVNFDFNIDDISKYKKIYFLVKKNNYKIPFEFYKLNISKELYDTVSKELILYEINTINLKNQKHYNNILLLSKEYINIFNIFNYNLEDINLIIPIFNINFLNILSYLNQYNDLNTLKDLFDIIILNKYFNNNNNEIQNKILNLKESNYWNNEENLFLNLTNKFKNIQFTFNSSRIKNQNIKLIFNNDNYFLSDNNKKYLDISTVINNENIYKITNNEYTNDDINKLFDSLNNSNKFLLFCQLSISKEYCNLVVNNKYILENMKPFINKYPHIIRYVLGYSWIKFYIEECITNINIKETDTFIFDIETASLLPLFPFSYQKPKLNPYMPILLSNKVLHSNKNFNGLYDYFLDSKSTYVNKGICNLKEFKYRMNIFCTGNSNNDLFENINFEELNIGITGSIMAACLQKHNPLINNFKSNTDDEIYNKYFDEYYSNSDVDIMFKKSNIINFLKKSYILYEQIIINLLKFNKDAIKDNIKINMYKTAYLFINTNYIIENINIPNITKKNIINYINNNINDNKIKELFKPLYESLKNEYYKNLLNKISENEKIMIEKNFPEFFNTENNDYLLFINNNNNDIIFNYKLKIISKYLKRPLELFQIKYNNFFSAVSQFHVPCVRSYYIGNNVYMTPSCISAHMTFMNIDNKYIASKKDPLEILLKYRSRGFGAWLSNKQLKIIEKYCNVIKYWKQLFIKPINNKIGVFNNDFKLPLEIDNMCFFPKYNNKEFFIDLESNNYKGLLNNDIKCYSEQSFSSILKLRYNLLIDDNSIFDKINNYQVINNDGNINKPETWIFHYIKKNEFNNI
jgi:hypothetical protein